MADNQTEKQKVQELTDKDVELTMMDAQKEIDALQDSETEINKSQKQQEASDARKAAQLLHGSMDKYGIYQLKNNPELDKFRFEGTESLKRMGITKYNFDTIVPENYEQVYMGELSEFRGRTQGETLEAIYTKFNIDHPADYKAHSLSVSDIVVLHENRENSAHFVDTFGFTGLPQFLHELEEKAEDLTVTFTVAECGEFHGIGAYYKDIPTLHVEGTDCLEDDQADLLTGKTIDVDFLNYMPDVRDHPSVQDAIKKLVEAFPEKEVNDRETKEQKIQALAGELDRLSYDMDPYEYSDTVSDQEAQVQRIAEDIRNGNIGHFQNFLQTSIEEGTDENSEQRAKELLVKLAEYKPLAKIEEMEEQNYNMIDNVLNNGVEKFNRKEDKQKLQQGRISLKERLCTKQCEVSEKQVRDPQDQNKVKKNSREM